LPKSHFNQILFKKALISLFLAVGIYLAHFNWLDTLAEDYTEQGIKRTLITYAISRSLNGVISVAQGTEVAVAPAGVGLNFAPGQILDPVNDLIERFSWIVMASGTSLGIQRIFLEISSSVVITWLLTVLIIFGVLTLWLYTKDNEIAVQRRRLLNKVLIITIFIRFSIPLIAVANELIYVSYLQPKYEVAQNKLEQTSEEIQLINDSSKAKNQAEISQNSDEGFMDKAQRWLNNTQRSLNVENQVEALKQAVSDVSQQVINMIVVFIVQTILFPLLFLWLMIRGGRMVLKYF